MHELLIANGVVLLAHPVGWQWSQAEREIGIVRAELTRLECDFLVGKTVGELPAEVSRAELYERIT